MPGNLLHANATLLCPHGGQVQVVPAQVRVQVSGQPVATLGDQDLIAGCAFTVPPAKPQPCVLVKWLVGALKVKAGGQPVLLQSSTGLCQSAEQIPAGPPSVIAGQARVRGT